MICKNLFYFAVLFRGVVRWIKLGALYLNGAKDTSSLIFEVADTYYHPEYFPPSHYHDIALIKLKKSVNFTETIHPACLFNKEKLPEGHVIATGWGATGFAEEQSSILMKVDLNLFTQASCQASYSTISKRRLPNGIIENYQLCAGDETGKDTCKVSRIYGPY